MSLTERIIQLSRDLDKIENSLVGLYRTEKHNFTLPDDRHLTYIIEGVSCLDRYEPEVEPCLICLDKAPLTDELEAKQQRYNQLMSSRLRHRGLKPNDCWELIHLKEEIPQLIIQVELYDIEHPHPMRCHSCGMLLGIGHRLEVIQYKGHYFCSTCPINPEDYNERMAYWRKPPIYIKEEE